MKKLLSFTIIGAIIFTSCQKELHFDTAAGTGGTGGTGNPGGSTGSSTDCKTCVYMPLCDGSWYTYNDTLYTTASQVTDTFRVIKDTTIASKTFVKIYSPASNGYTYYNCTDGATRLITYNGTTSGGNTINVFDITFVKANLPVGTTWKDVIKNQLGQDVTYASSIVEKGINRTVNGKTYADVIHVRMETSLNVAPVGFMVFSYSEYYIAKGVGSIETIITDPSGTTIIQHRALKSYFIP